MRLDTFKWKIGRLWWKCKRFIQISKTELFVFLCFTLPEWPQKIKRRIWNKHLRIWWNKLYIREDEFHSSLDLDVEAMIEMTKEERSRYIKDVARRRSIAHNRDLKKREAG